MLSIYRLKADELDSNFIEALKNSYQNKEIEIIVQDVEDETEYLLRSDANREHLLTAIDNVKHHKNLININVDSL